MTVEAKTEPPREVVPFEAMGGKWGPSGAQPSYDAIRYFLTRFKLLYAAILTVTVGVALLESFSVAAFLPLFASLLNDSSDPPGGIVGLIMNATSLFPFGSPLVAASVMLIAIFVLKTIGILTRDLLVAYAGAKVLYLVKRDIMDRYSNAKYQFMLDSQQGSLIYNALAAPSSVGNLLLTLSRMITSLLKIVAVMAVLFSILPVAASAFIGLGVVYYFVIHVISKKISFTLGQGRVAASTEQTIVANEFLSGFRQIISFNTGSPWVRRFDRANREYSELYTKDLGWQAVPRPILELAALGLLLGFVLLLRLGSEDTFSTNLAALGVFAVAVVQILPAVNAFGGTRMQLLSGLPNVQLVHDIVTREVPSRRDGGNELNEFTNAVSFENVTFAHQGRDTLLSGINFRLGKGQVTAIVGPSGSGKTTIINLLLGLFEPSDGQIIVDGKPLNSLSRDSWLKRIGFVSQDPFIFNTTIEENIRFNRPSGPLDDVIKATTIANAHDFISDLPNGYDTVVGDRGMKLSGGQQQRLCIARAVLESPDILIFDEATSSLDSVSERQVQDAIDHVSIGRTVIIIAHRLSTIRNADNIIVLDDGKVVEQGTHQELMDIQGHYSRQVAAAT